MSKTRKHVTVKVPDEIYDALHRVPNMSAYLRDVIVTRLIIDGHYNPRDIIDDPVISRLKYTRREK